MAKMMYSLPYSLPYDIKTEIFSQLPVDSIIQCKYVCKTWQTLIVELLNDPSFVDIHTRRFLSSSPSPPAADADASYSFLMKEKFSNDNNSKHWSIVGSCNGLVCLVRKHYDYLRLNSVCICNPVTKEYVNLLPQFDLSHPSDLKHLDVVTGIGILVVIVIGIGFGYVHSTKEYKCVTVTWVKKNMYLSVYTIGSGTWRMEKVDQKDPCHGQLLYGTNERELAPAAGLLFNGALYWMNRYSIHGDIISFDLEKEELRIVPSPPQSVLYVDKIIGVLGGCFCLIRTDCSNGSKDILVMDKEQRDYTWTKKLRIEPAMEKNIKPPFVLEAKVFSNYDYTKFASYDPRTRSHLDHHLIINNYNMNFLMVDVYDHPWPYVSKFKMIPYIRSLVSLKALGENDADVATTKRKRVDIYDPWAMHDSRPKINTD